VVAVTVTEQPQAPTRDQLQAQAMRRLKAAGLSGDGFQAMLAQLGGDGVTTLGQLSDEVIGKLARVGASAETIQRWNADGAPAAAPAPAADDSVPAEVFSEPGFPDPDEQDDPDDLPAAWAA
jgi:hypothetical protein